MFGCFLGRNHPNIFAMVLLEWDRTKAEYDVDSLSLSKYKRERTGQGLPRAWPVREPP